MFNLFIDLIDRVIQLSKIKDARRKNVFAEIYKPLFGEMEKIHIDYVSALHSCLRHIDSDQYLVCIVNTIGEKRVKFAPAREKVRIFAQSSLQSDHGDGDSPEQEFARSIAAYFNVPLGGSRWAVLQSAVEYLENPEIGGVYLPASNETEAQKILSGVDYESIFALYGVVEHLVNNENITQESKIDFASQILTKEIEDIGNLWSTVCYYFSTLNVSVART